MRITRRTAVIIAVVCAAGAALLTVVYLKGAQPKAPAAPQEVATVPIPVPVAPLAAGTRITTDQLTTKQIPREAVPADAVTKPDELYGQVLALDTPAGEPIARSKLAAFSPQAGLAFEVPAGLRAVTVAVDNISGVSGFLKLKDHVDVLATFDTPQGSVTRTILQDVQVLGLGTESVMPQPAPSAQGGEAKPAAAGNGGGGEQPPPTGVRPSATLAITPQQAQVLVLAATKGRLHLALRPKSDARMVALPPTTNASVVGALLAAPPPPAGGAPSNPAAQTVGAMGTAGGRAGAGLTPAGAGGLGGVPGAAGGAEAPKGPTVEVFKGTQREVVAP